MILVSEAGWCNASGFEACRTAPVLPSTTIDAVGGEYFSAWAASLAIAKAAASGVRPNKQQRSPRQALQFPHAIAHPVPRGGSHPLQATRRHFPLEGLQSAVMAFFNALYSPAGARHPAA